MRRSLGSGGSALALAALALGPWLGFVPTRSPMAQSPAYEFAANARLPVDEPIPDRPVLRRQSGGCNCKTVVVNATNVVHEAKVKTGDATVINVSVAYVSAAFAQGGNVSIEIDQEAEAMTGDAVAGQILGVNGVGPGCTHVIVRAINDVSDSKVLSGDATAINRSFVYLDPGVDRDAIDIDVEQDADADSGDAIAGQIIGAQASGDGCGKVDIIADNSVRETKVKTGKATSLNESEVENCAAVGCARELLRAAHWVSSVQMCLVGGCRQVPSNEIPVMVASLTNVTFTEAAEPSATPTATPEEPDESEDVHRRGRPSPAPDDSSEGWVTNPSPSPTPQPYPNAEGAG